MYNVSCVIPVHNGVKYIEDTIRNILSQTLQNFQIIFVDDWSSDGSVEIIERAIAGDDRFILLPLEENHGAAYCRNYGFSKACGEYVMFLDSDDAYYPEMFERAYAAAVEANADLVVFGYDINVFDNDENLVRTNSFYPGDYKVFSDGLDSVSNLEKCDHVPWNKIVRRNTLVESGIRFQEIPTDNDIFYSQAVALYVKRIVFLPEKLLAYYYNRNDSLTRHRLNKKKYVLEAFEAVYDYITLNKYKISASAYMNYMLDYLGYACVYNNRLGMDIRDYTCSFAENEGLGRKLEVELEKGNLYKHNIEFAKRLLEQRDLSIINIYELYKNILETGFKQARFYGKKIALWGYGGRGKALMEWLIANEMTVDYIIDQDVSKQGICIAGKTICKYEAVKDSIDIIWITNSSLYDDIRFLVADKDLIALDVI